MTDDPPSAGDPAAQPSVGVVHDPNLPAHPSTYAKKGLHRIRRRTKRKHTPKSGQIAKRGLKGE